MALPKKRHSTRRKGKRRASKKITLPLMVNCHNCHKPKKPHSVCANCGFYKGKEVIDTKPKTAKKKTEQSPTKSK